MAAEEELLNNQRVADQVLEQRLLTTIQLIQALGGGWQDSTIYTPGASARPVLSARPPVAPTRNEKSPSLCGPEPVAIQGAI